MKKFNSDGVPKVDGSSVIQPISVSSLPLPEGAAIETGNLSDIKSNTDKLDILLSTLRDAITGTSPDAKTINDLFTQIQSILNDGVDVYVVGSDVNEIATHENIDYADQTFPVYINYATSGDKTLVTAAENKIIKVVACFLAASAKVSVRFKSGSSNLGGALSLGTTGSDGLSGFVLPPNPYGWLKTIQSIDNLILNIGSNVQVSGYLTCYYATSR